MSRNFKLPSPQKVEIGGVHWREHYGCYHVNFGGVLELSFAYRGSRYEVSMLGKPVGTAEDKEAAALMAINAAR